MPKTESEAKAADWGVTAEGKWYKVRSKNGRLDKNPNVIGEQNYKFVLPLEPKPYDPPAGERPMPTPMGPMAVAANGVPIYNAFATDGEDKRAKFQTSKPHISAVFHSFWLILDERSSLGTVSKRADVVAPSLYGANAELAGALRDAIAAGTPSAACGVAFDGFPSTGPSSKDGEVVFAKSSYTGAAGHLGHPTFVAGAATSTSATAS
ncbi:hypothetical protein JL721_5877 [Aureococcus anophagefferens]|nr:hypothetical protein JL721_5877 [Aureococcus anophagefferens]